MKALTVRLPEDLIAQIDAESRERKVSRSDVVREHLRRSVSSRGRQTRLLDEIADLIGSVDGLPVDLSSRKKQYLKAGHGQKRHR